jgi:thiosulfate/3-mercaptopyruvate sulfurtransferase
MTLVSTDWLSENLSKVKIFDATWHMPNSKRDAYKEFLDQHIPGAIFWDLDEHSDKDSILPHMMPNSDYWTRMLWSFGIENKDHIIIYDSSDLYSSCRFWFSLKYFGHQKVSILNGGFKKWLSEKKIVTNKTHKIEQINSYKTHENFNLIKTKQQVTENIKKKSFILVDGRSRDRFEGKVEEPRPELRKGCIPNSKNIPFKNCIDVKINTFKEKSDLIKIFNENNVDYSQPNVFSCGSGVTACVLGLAYFLISDKNAVIYDGSYAEWGKK